MVAVIREFGFRVPVLAKSTGDLVDGHLRLKAAMALGLDTVPVITVDDMSLEQVRAFRIMINRSATWADWDDEALLRELQALQLASYDLSLTGFDQRELDEMLMQLDGGTDKDSDDIPEPPDEPQVRDGEVWLLGRHRLMCGDSTSRADMRRLMGEELADMIWTDPPYNVDYSGKAGKIKNDKMSAVDFDQFLLAVHRVMFETVRPGGGVTKAITRSLGAGGADDNRAQGGFYVPEIVNQAMSCKWSRGTSGPAGDEHHNLICPPLTTRPYGDNDAQQEKLVVSQYGGITGSLTLRHDSSPCADRGMTVVAIHPHCIGRGPDAGPQGKEYLEDGSVYTIDTKAPQAVAFAQNQIGEVRTGDMCGTLNRNSNASGRNTPMVFTEVAPTIGSSGPSYSRTGNSRVEAEALAGTAYGVRRLTPRECERLQGFPDDYTLIPGASDSARYKALGNSMAVPVMRWIGERIQRWENILEG